MIERIAIVGTGLIGGSIGLALRRAGFAGEIVGIDANEAEAAAALAAGAVSRVGGFGDAVTADVVVLAVPVMAIMDWMGRLAPAMGPRQLVTDVGSTKLAICEVAARLCGGAGQARFLPGHPMAGKESGGAALAEASLFDGAMWLFTPVAEEMALETEWRGWVTKFGARTMDLDAARHDRVCAWVSHLPQMVSTAMSAMFADEFAAEPELAAEFRAIGGRALREMTRLGASPYSMWRDVAHTNTEPLGATLFALEQRLAHVRENLKTPELRAEFEKANAFRRER
jgi:prephenate dehydrogenase